MKIFKSFVGLASVVFALAFAFSAQAAIDLKGTDLEIILDCSGSMAGMIGGKSKMEIAKESLTSVINQIPEKSYVGFRAYGHQYDRSVKNCTDSELIYPVGEINKQQLISKIKSLQPRGWTPIGYSLEQSKNDFPVSAEYQNMIILVSDGEETCGTDPCAKIKEMQNAGFEVIVNTVGFDVGDLAEQQLKCIADATGGEYKSVKNASELTESLRFFSSRAFEDFTTSGGAKAGTGFANAPLVIAGDYGGDILMGESKFYKVDVKKGQTITAVANVRRETATTGSLKCTCMLPGIKIFDKYKSSVGSAVAEGCSPYNDIKGIEGDDLNPASYKAQWTADASGSVYLAISGSWFSECDATDSYWKDKLKTKTDKAFYDVTVAVEGESTEAAAPTSTSKPTTGATPGSETGTIHKAAKENNFGNIAIIGIGALIGLGAVAGVVLLIKKRGSGPVASSDPVQPNPTPNPAPTPPPVEPVQPVQPESNVAPPPEQPAEEKKTDGPEMPKQ